MAQRGKPELRVPTDEEWTIITRSCRLCKLHDLDEVLMQNAMTFRSITATKYRSTMP